MLETNLANLFYRGKVRDTYDLGDSLLVIQKSTVVFRRPKLEGLFDYGYFLRHVDEVFERLGLG